MGLFKKKVDPITERSKALKDEISALESKIKKLSTQIEQTSPARSNVSKLLEVPESSPVAAIAEPVFEKVDQNRLHTPVEPEPPTPEHFNEFGVRKFDLSAHIKRFKAQVRAKPPANPKLVTFLAAGSVQGLRPLRYEKRVARNRFIFLSAIFLLVLWGLLYVFL